MSDNADSPLHSHEPQIPPALDDEGRCRVCVLLVEVERLRAALEQLAAFAGPCYDCFSWEIAREALEEPSVPPTREELFSDG